ncbi:hypothetical protein L7F22_063272 [Adiantum nelumboides]|nr:hypothetical protein [Adiantum nelumboides]
MADNNKENRMSIDDFDFAHEDATDDTSMMVNYLVTRLQQAMGNPALQGEGETSKRGLSTEKGVENPYQELKQLLEGKPSSKKKGHAQPERSPSREREESESQDESMEDVAPRRRRAQRSPTPTKRKRSPHSPHRHEFKREEKSSRRRRRERGHPLLPPHHPLPLCMKVAGILLKKNKGEDTEGHMLLGRDKVLAFIQQFDAVFGDEGFTESSKLRHVAMHYQKSARQWWASLRANGEAPKTWKALRASIMKQFLASDAKDKVLTEWRSLKLSPYESIHKYVDKFWEEKQEYKGKNFSQNSSKGNSNNNKAKEKGVFKGVQDFEMGDAMKANGTIINQEVSFTPLIGKLRLHIQGYMDKEDFFISPLKHEDVILGTPWFDRLAASIKFPERKISFKFREKDMYINAQDSGSSIPLVNDQALDKSIKSFVSAYMIFVKDSLNGVDETQVNENGMQVDLELSNFLNQFQDVLIDDILGELPPKRGDDDHMIELILGSSPPNKPPYRVSQAQQEEIMRQVNELVEKGMVRPSSSPFCSPILLLQKKDGTYPMCVDYRALNRITIKNRFPVPRVKDLFDKLQGSTYFSRIDLKSRYHQIRIVDEDIVMTAFCTMFGLYEYLVMPFGLTNAPATFNRMMDRIFRSHRNFTGVFFDDVIIYSKTIEEHKEHLKPRRPNVQQPLHAENGAENQPIGAENQPQEVAINAPQVGEQVDGHRQPVVVMQPDEQPAVFDDLQAENPPVMDHWVRRSTRVTRPPDRYEPSLDYAMLTDCGEPSCYKEAMQRDDSKKWFKAMVSEMQSLEKNHTWDLVDLPPGHKALPCKWVYKTKVTSDAASKYKARLVAKGYKQKHGVDFDEIFSPVVKLATLRLVLGLVAFEEMELKQMDVKTAFLHGDLLEMIYMMQPEGFVSKGQEKKPRRPNVQQPLHAENGAENQPIGAENQPQEVAIDAPQVGEQVDGHRQPVVVMQPAEQPVVFDDLQAENPPVTDHWVRRSTRVTRPPDRYEPSLDYVMLTDCGEPSCYKEAMQREDSKKWFKAMVSEMQSLEKNHTWDLVDLPPGHKALPCKWVYKTKVTSDAASKYKARLVAKGYKQKHGVDFDEIFSPVVKLATLRLVLGLVAFEEMELKQMDVKTAFLHGDLLEMIYMMQPEGCVKGTREESL